MRQRLLNERAEFAAGPAFAHAECALTRELRAVIETLEPQCLGVYWPVRSEFNASAVVVNSPIRNTLRLALPFVRKLPPRMEYRAWDGAPPSVRDDVGIPSIGAVTVVPEVVLVPCLGFTSDGFRLGYGGGFFDRWLAQHPHVTSVGVAWAQGLIADREFRAAAHDVALTLIVTERGVL